MASALLQRLQRGLVQEVGLSKINQQKPCPSSDERRQAAVLLAITDTPSPCLLMIRRALHLPLHPGEIGLPGGKVDPIDSDLWATASREAWEEVGLRGDRVSYAGTFAPRISMTGLAVTPCVGVIDPQALELKANRGEVAEILFAPLDFFADAKNLRADRILRDGTVRLTARFQYAHYTIWGITAGFVVELVNRLYDANLNVESRAARALTGVCR